MCLGLEEEEESQVIKSGRHESKVKVDRRMSEQLGLVVQKGEEEQFDGLIGGERVRESYGKLPGWILAFVVGTVEHIYGNLFLRASFHQPPLLLSKIGLTPSWANLGSEFVCCCFCFLLLCFWESELVRGLLVGRERSFLQSHSRLTVLLQLSHEREAMNNGTNKRL